MEIIDNYLAPDLFKIVQNTIMLSQNTPWFLNTDVSGHGIEKHPYFTHLMHHEHRANSNHFDQCIVPILFMFGHKAAILYLNTNDGYTIIGDEKVESIANRLLRFDATQMHHSTTCTDQQYRANINFNYF